MNEYLTDTEKRILLAALNRERKFLETDKEYLNLLSVVTSLERKFEYDKIFKLAYEDGKNANAGGYLK